MGSTSYLTKPKISGYRTKSGSSVGSDKEINGKLRRSKVRRPKMDYGLKRVPDYTELAYKEAVSKLRYFLSGNYAPSIRSYGGSASIKNLDESDGDLDKKYLLDKPRPRLTAKYASLYADSLNNYAPHTGKSIPIPPATAPADLTGGTNPDVVNFIQKQEEYIEQLERESQYCRDELNNLLGKVKEVISENEHLHEAQKNKLISRMFTTHGSETDDLDDVGDSTGLDSDHKATITKTRKPKTRTTRLEGPNIVFESRISELEAQLAQSKIDLKKVQDENNENKRKLASGLVDSTCLDGFKRQIDNLQRDKSSLESQISKLKTSLEQRDGDLDGRYKRNDVIEQQLRDERNSLENEVRRLKEDLASERAKIRELVGEGSRRAIQERSAAEQRYNAHCDSLQHELAAQYDSVAKLQLDLERQRREENELKRELSMKNSAIEELKMELKSKTASLQADLTQAHAEKASMEEELASARLAIERHQRQAKHEANRLNSEIQSLRQRLDRADADLVHSRRENLRLTEQISTLEKELNMKSLTPNSPEKNKKEKEMSSMLESIENKHAPTPHLPSTDRNAPPAAGGGPDHPRADPTGHPDQPDIRPDTRDHRPLSKQASRTSIKSYQEPDHTNQPDRRLAEQTEPTQLDDNIKEDIADEKEVEYEKEQHDQEKYPVENVEQAYEQGYENPDQNYAEKTEPYYEQTEGYDQNYQEGQFENYEQYPQQYTDPNAQYEGQYENYATDGYQQEYDQTQYVDPATQYVDPNTQYVDPNTQYVEPTTQYDAPQSEQAPTEHEAPTGSKISNSPVKGQS
ncbi:serologically defined colon cancer antigen 8 homolog isoform X3 [Cydia pomonella]|uniref:serologically defined colon cancer antigen 8 homolog isoform X3 n=1 Tax=Cydia pomonella TaxID=82600 RepID=UPI002ADDF824|nr:serologically defined colon cancer antigen 8 homolog isoform X3 [Cydia pomonella]